MTKAVEVVILGGTGFGAGELLRLFLGHPHVHVKAVVSSSAAGKAICSAHPHLRGLYTENFVESVEAAGITDKKELVFISALPHGESVKGIEKLTPLFPLALFIDLSGDLRLKDEKLNQEFYPHTPYAQPLRQKAVYGLPEVNAESIKDARLISNPGCLATAALLATLPLKGLIKKQQLSPTPRIQLSMATGSSGSGKDPKATTHHPIRHANFLSYKPLQHQHTPEIAQSLSEHGLSPSIAFVPHSLPVSRGILCTAFIELANAASYEEIKQTYAAFYHNAPFVRIIEGACAELENVVGSNFCDISFAVKDTQLVVHTSIDNLVKGMAGQAIENLNIACGFDRMSGLKVAALRPV